MYFSFVSLICHSTSSKSTYAELNSDNNDNSDIMKDTVPEIYSTKFTGGEFVCALPGWNVARPDCVKWPTVLQQRGSCGIIVLPVINVSPLVIRGHVRWRQPWRRQIGLPLRRRASWSFCSAQSPPTDALHRPCHVPWCNPWQRVPHTGGSMSGGLEWLQKVLLNTYCNIYYPFLFVHSRAKENCNVSVGVPHVNKLNYVLMYTVRLKEVSILMLCFLFRTA